MSPEKQSIDFDALVPTHQSRVVSVARRVLGSREAAEDVAHKIFLHRFSARPCPHGSRPTATSTKKPPGAFDGLAQRQLTLLPESSFKL